MAFLFQDQNQGIRTTTLTHAKTRGPPQPFSFIRTVTVGFGIAPNLLTLFPASRKKALAGLGSSPFTAGGDFRPALRTSARPGWTRLSRNMTKPRQPGKAFGMGKQHVPMSALRLCEVDVRARPLIHRRGEAPANG